jgi:hypothetical protein
MDLKNAIAVCLISLFSATLVVLIARSLDNQAAARLEPQLASIVEELRALRAQGGIAAAQAASVSAEAVQDGLVVYYFHGKIRCPTCQAIESQAKETVQNQFAKQLKNGEIVWKIANYEDAAAKPLATKFDIQMPVVVLAQMKNGEIQNWKRLDEVWPLVGDKSAFMKYMQGEIEKMFNKEQSSATVQTPATAIPVPDDESSSEKKTPAIPIPE